METAMHIGGLGEGEGGSFSRGRQPCRECVRLAKARAAALISDDERR